MCSVAGSARFCGRLQEGAFSPAGPRRLGGAPALPPHTWATLRRCRQALITCLWRMQPPFCAGRPFCEHLQEVIGLEEVRAGAFTAF